MMMMLMMKKMKSGEKEACFKKMEPEEATITTQTGTCLPQLTLDECGQETLLSGMTKETTEKSWTAIIADSNKELHCGAVLVCSSWVITSASCVKQLEVANSPPKSNQEKV